MSGEKCRHRTGFRVRAIAWIFLTAIGYAGAAQAGDRETCMQPTNVDRSIPACSRVIDAKPASQKELVDAYTFRAAAFRNKHEFDAALRDLDAALRLDPNFVDAHVVRGTVYLAKRNLDGALLDFDAALKIDPNHADARKQRAQLYVAKGNPPAALRDYDELVRLEPKSAEAYYLRGAAYGLAGQREKAFRDFEKAVALAPDNPLGLTGLGNAYVNGLGVEKDRDHGLALIRKAARTGFTPAKEILAKLGQSAP
jgi:tetratricopeptide (TPR) repeat protein